MKKYFWPIAAIFLIVAFLYARPYLFRESAPERDPARPGQTVLQPTAKESPAEPPASKRTADLTFPPRSDPLVLPAFTWPPFIMKDDSGKWIGACIEITEAVLNRMGYRVQWVDFAFARALEEMHSSSYPGIAPCVVGGGREEYILFSEPVASIYSVLWKKKSDDFTWHTYDDLKGRIIGASYYHYGAGFFEAAEAAKFTLDKVASKTPELIHFRKLLQGKTDMFICELSVGLYLRHQYAPEFDPVDYCPTGIGPTRPLCFAVSRKYFEGRPEQMQAFMGAFNVELAAFAGEGQRKKIFDKYHMLIKVDDEGRVVVPGGKWKPE
jgi:polar amino acid transport system substrate-binding protein